MDEKPTDNDGVAVVGGVEAVDGSTQAEDDFFGDFEAAEAEGAAQSLAITRCAKCAPEA